MSLLYDDDHFSIISVPGMRERTIYLHGFSKAWAMTVGEWGSPVPSGIDGSDDEDSSIYDVMCADLIARGGD